MITDSTADAVRAALIVDASADVSGKIERRMTDPTRSVIGFRMGTPDGTVFAIAKDNTGMPLAEVERLLDADEYEMRLVAVSIIDFKARGKDAARSAVYELSVPCDLATTVHGQSAERR